MSANAMNMLRQTAGSSGSNQLSQVMDYAMEDGGGGIYPTHKGLMEVAQ